MTERSADRLQRIFVKKYKIIDNTAIVSNIINKYSSAFDVATGVNYMGGNATFNGYSGVKTSATLGFQK